MWCTARTHCLHRHGPSHTHNPLHWHHILFIQDEGERKAMVGKSTLPLYSKNFSSFYTVHSNAWNTQMINICMSVYMWLNIPVRGKVVVGANSVVPEKSLGAILSCL